MRWSVVIQDACRDLGGVASRQELDGLGVPSTAIDQAVRMGRLVAVHPGVYRPAALALDHPLRLRAALAAAGPGAAVSHRSAAARMGLVRGYQSVVELTVPSANRPRLHDVVLHRTLHIPESHVADLDGLPTTTIHRTLADLGAVVSQAVVDRAMEQAVIDRLTTIERIYDFVDGYGRQGRSGVGTLRLCLEERVMGERPPDSALEVMFGRLITRFGIEPPVYQYEICGPHGFVARVDAAWPDRKLVGEVDGLAAHGTRRALQHDLARQNALVALGWRVQRFTWRDVVRRPQRVARDLQLILNAPD